MGLKDLQPMVESVAVVRSVTNTRVSWGPVDVDSWLVALPSETR